MSKHAPDVNLVIGWSTRGITTYEPGTRAVRSFDSLADAAQTINSRNALVAVSRRSVFVRTLHVPNASLAEVSTIVQMRLGDLFPLPGHELAYSVDLTDDISPEGRLAVVVAMPALDLRKLHEEMKAAGIRVQRVVPMAYGSAALAKDLGLQNTAVVSREDGGIGIDIVSNGVLRYSRVSGGAANAAAEVCRTYTVAGIPCGDILAADGLRVDEADSSVDTSPLEALAGVWPTKVPALELPEAVALKVAKARSTRSRLVAGMFFAGILLSLYAYLDYADELAAVEQSIAQSASRVSRAEREKAAAEKLAKEAVTVQAAVKLAFEPGQQLSDVVAVASNEVPAGVWLTGITLERGKQMLIRGTSQNSEAISDYLNRLTVASAPVSGGKDAGVAPRFRDVKLAFATNGKIDETTVVQFSITAFPVGNLPAVDTTTQKKKPGAKK